jgi:hypothetical protein
VKDRDKDFEKQLPHGAVPTNLRGVYALPPLPVGFDPNAATPAALIRNGILWKRPAQDDHPALVKAWRDAFSRRWDRIVPRMEVGHGRETYSTEGTPQVAAPIHTDTWSGVVCLNPFSDIGKNVTVTAQWVVPTVRLLPTSPFGAINNLPGAFGQDSSSWIGLGGVGDDPTQTNLLQAGIQHYVLNTGEAHYIAWYEWLVTGADAGKYPYINQTPASLVVRPGDTISASVQHDPIAGYVSLGNQTTGKAFSMVLPPPQAQAAPFVGGSAEWILEAPGGGSAFDHYLPDITPVVFTNAIVCGPGARDVLDPSSGLTTAYRDQYIEMVVEVAATGGLTIRHK